MKIFNLTVNINNANTEFTCDDDGLLIYLSIVLMELGYSVTSDTRADLLISISGVIPENVLIDILMKFSDWSSINLQYNPEQ